MMTYGVTLNPPIIIGFPQITTHPIILLDSCCATIYWQYRHVYDTQ